MSVLRRHGLGAFRLCLTAWAVWAGVACERLIGARSTDECLDDEGCPVEERCELDTRRCAPRDATPQLDAALGFVDADPPPVDVPDATPTPQDAAPARDVAPDADVTAADCFDSPSGRVESEVGPDDDLEFPPRGYCTPMGTVVVRRGAGETTEIAVRGAAGERSPLTLPKGTEVRVTDDAVLLTTPNPERRGVANVALVDLARAPPMPRFLEPRGLPQRQPARAGNVTAFVEETPSGEAEPTSEVILHFDDDRRTACGRADMRQWGVAVRADGLVAFFEQARGSARQDLVVLRNFDCRERLALEVPGRVEQETHLVVDATRLLWIRTAEAVARREIAYVPVDALVDGSRALSVQGVTSLNPLEFDARADWLLVTSFERGRRTLRLFDLQRGQERPVGAAGQAHGPMLTGTYAVWSLRDGTSPWEVRYERLPER
jgi:hypothetical protein